MLQEANYQYANLLPLKIYFKDYLNNKRNCNIVIICNFLHVALILVY